MGISRVSSVSLINTKESASFLCSQISRKNCSLSVDTKKHPKKEGFSFQNTDSSPENQNTATKLSKKSKKPLKYIHNDSTVTKKLQKNLELSGRIEEIETVEKAILFNDTNENIEDFRGVHDQNLHIAPAVKIHENNFIKRNFLATEELTEFDKTNYLSTLKTHQNTEAQPHISRTNSQQNSQDLTDGLEDLADSSIALTLDTKLPTTSNDLFQDKPITIVRDIMKKYSNPAIKEESENSEDDNSEDLPDKSYEHADYSYIDAQIMKAKAENQDLRKKHQFSHFQQPEIKLYTEECQFDEHTGEKVEKNLKYEYP